MRLIKFAWLVAATFIFYLYCRNCGIDHHDLEDAWRRSPLRKFLFPEQEKCSEEQVKEYMRIHPSICSAKGCKSPAVGYCANCGWPVCSYDLFMHLRDGCEWCKHQG